LGAALIQPAFNKMKLYAVSEDMLEYNGILGFDA
jgi:hypothetical protein